MVGYLALLKDGDIKLPLCRKDSYFCGLRRIEKNKKSKKHVRANSGYKYLFTGKKR